MELTDLQLPDSGIIEVRVGFGAESALGAVAMPLLYPLDVTTFLRKRKTLRREFDEGTGFLDVRIAVLGGTTTSEMVANLEVLLRSRGIRPLIYESDYNRYYEEATVDSTALEQFQPDIAWVCTSWQNLRSVPNLLATDAEVSRAVDTEVEKLRHVWTALQQRCPGCTVIQNNCDPWPVRPLGNLEAGAAYSTTQFVAAFNAALSAAARSDPRLLLVDVHGLASQFGTKQWFSAQHWFQYKMAQTPEAALRLANSVSALIAALYGRSRKCLVLDLDNTLWGGVIGDDGPDRIQLGKETAVAEAYTSFQRYCASLRQRGVLLAVCSKNDDAIARSGFEHPDSVLRSTDFACFVANWRPKDENIEAIARQLNIGLDSIVFIDDNPAERMLVRAQLPAVAVPEVGSDVSGFAEIIEESGYFEPVNLSREDVERTRMYADNAVRLDAAKLFTDHGEYLDSLGMEAEIDVFSPVYLERIAQLTNKTNQFNLTTKRYTRAELESFAARPDCVTLYGRLRDKFGDNGLVSVVLGFVKGSSLEIDLWLMSCRVLKRDLELAMLDNLVRHTQDQGVSRLVGRYFRTAKNAMVADHYGKLGFARLSESADGSSSVWELKISEGDYQPRNRHIREVVRERTEDFAGAGAAVS